MTRRRTHESKSHKGRWVLGFLLGGLILVIVGVLGFDLFQGFQVRRLIRRANSYIEVGDLRSAGLTAKNILQINIHNVDALRILARIAEETGEASALEWRQRAAAERPGSQSDIIALARAAIKAGQLPMAESSLNGLDEPAKRTGPYHEGMARLQLAKKNRDAAEQEYVEAIRLDPGNDEYQLALALLQLSSPSEKSRTGARKTLRDLLEKRPVRLAAARALREDAVERRDPELVSLARMIFDWPEATVEDRIRYVEISGKLGLKDFPETLTRVQDEASLDPIKLTELLSWMSANHQAVLAIEWTRRLPPASLEQRPVFVALADCYAAALDCPGLKRWAGRFNWKDLEYLRHAYLAYGARTCKDEPGFTVEWSKASQAAGNTEAIMTLQRAAAKWGWKSESVALLWQISKDRDQQKGALATLNQYYTTEGDTKNLYKVSSRWQQASPNDPDVKNNLAQLSLLLGVNTDAAENMAKQLHQHSPEDANFASTYAFALYLRGDARGALKIMDSLPESELRRPEIAAYYGIILTAAGDRTKAPSFLELGRQAKLLPEERTLVEKATDAVSSLR